MVLQFNPPPYVDREKELADLWNNALSSGANSFGNARRNSRQQQLQELQIQLLQQEEARKQAEEGRKATESRSEWGTRAPSEMTTPIPGPMTQDQSFRSMLSPESPGSPAPGGSDGGMVAKFRSWQQSRRQGPAQPDASGMPQPSVGYKEVLPGMFPAQTERGLGWSGMTSPGSKGIDSAAKLFEAQKKLQGETPDSLEKILAGKVQRGEMTLEQALKMKTANPTPPKPQFVGTQGDQGVIYDGSGFKTSPLPGGQPLGPKNQPTLPASEGEKLGDFNNILTQIGYVRKNYKPEFVGMLDSRTQAARQMTGIGADPQAAAFQASLGAIRNKLLNMLSGAAISPEEYQRLLTQLPNEKASEVDFNAKMDSFEQNIKDTLANRQQEFQAAGYRGQSTIPVNAASGARQGGTPEMKVINGKRYVKQGGQWFEQ